MNRGTKIGRAIRVPLATTLAAVLAVAAPAEAKRPAKPTTDPSATQPAAGTFRPIGVAEPVGTMALTEDGRYLLLSHEEADHVTVWDVAAGRAVQTIGCPSPRAMICRGGHLFVGSFGHGKVLVFDEKTWGQTDELLTGLTDVQYLSAAAGPAFGDRLIASCGGSANRGTLGDAAVVIDVAHDTHQTFDRCGLTVASADGRFVYAMGEGGRARRTADFLDRGREATEVKDHYPVRGEFAAVAGPSGWVYTEQAVFTPDVSGGLVELKGDLGGLVVPDATRPAVYVLTAGGLAGYRTNPTLDALGRAAAKVAVAKQSRARKDDVRRFYDLASQQRIGVFDAPIAVTVDGRLHVFLHESARPVVDTATFDPMGGPADAAAGPAAAADDGPIEVSVGKPFTRQVAVPAGARASLMSGPAGLTLSAGQVLAWTPPAAAGGTTEVVKLRLDRADGSAPTFVRYTLAVDGPPAVASADGRRRGPKPPVDPDAEPEAPPAITVPYDMTGITHDFAFAPSFDGHHLLVLTGSRLRITDLTGTKVEQNLKLPRRCNHIAERDDCYVATTANTLELIDKRTLTSRRSIRLHTSETYDLALNPVLRVAYVALHDEALPADDSVRSRRVAVVNETTGSVLVTPGVYGQWLAVDPAGRRLFVGLHQTYQAGYRIDFNFDDFIVPAYGDVDVLGVLPLRAGVPGRGRASSDPGVNGRAVRVSPDGAAVSYVAAAGRPVYSDAVPALDPADLNETLATYSLKGLGGPQDLCYHPTLPLVAATTGDHVVLFDRATGDRLDDKLDLPPEGRLHNADRVMFSPDGRSVLVDPSYDWRERPPRGGERPKPERALIAIPIRLTEAEAAALAKGPPAGPKAVPAPDAKPAPPDHDPNDGAEPLNPRDRT